MAADRLPVTIAVQPWFYDHAFGGRAVLPAVEILLILGSEVNSRYPDIDVRTMREAAFSRFLEIPLATTSLDVVVELEPRKDGSVRAALLSRKVFPKITRMLEHARALFFPQTGGHSIDTDSDSSCAFVAEKSLSAGQVYREYVPFGSACHTLKGTLSLNRHEVRAALQAQAIPQKSAVGHLLGSPFPLDGAMHAACVLGQQHVDFIPFPVGFAGRIVHRPTRPEAGYVTRIRLISRDTDQLIFDLGIEDARGVIYEEVTGLAMRNVM
jgi:hypothetical protein